MSPIARSGFTPAASSASSYCEHGFRYSNARPWPKNDRVRHFHHRCLMCNEKQCASFGSSICSQETCPRLATYVDEQSGRKGVTRSFTRPSRQPARRAKRFRGNPAAVGPAAPGTRFEKKSPPHGGLSFVLSVLDHVPIEWGSPWRIS